MAVVPIPITLYITHSLSVTHSHTHSLAHSLAPLHFSCFIQAYSAPDYCALMVHAGVLAKEQLALVKPATPLEATCSALYAQLKLEKTIPPSTYHLPQHIASCAKLHSTVLAFWQI